MNSSFIPLLKKEGIALSFYSFRIKSDISSIVDLKKTYPFFSWNTELS